MRIVITGAPVDIDFVIRICRDKIRRGLLLITDYPDIPQDSKDVELADTKTVSAADTKQVNTKRVKKK